MRKTNKIAVSAFGRLVGTLATLDGVAAFGYDEGWLREGFSISPLSLPLEERVFIPGWRPFEGLHGVFSDSLPDGWGRLLLDRYLRTRGGDPESLGPLERLSLVGSSGLGALEYRPSLDGADTADLTEFDEMAREARRVFDDEAANDLDLLYRLGGSSGGARPKIMVDLEGEPWIVKFHTTREGGSAGRMEYDYALCARECGIEIPEVRLLDSKECEGYFAVRRFDRFVCGGGSRGRLHMVSAGGLLETTHRVPNLDYSILMKLTMRMTRDYSQLEALYHRACFNVFAHNRDDHAKNFSFLCDDRGTWRLSPAYDLTYSNSIGGEHATMVAGNGKNPGSADLVRLARGADLDADWAVETARTIKGIVSERLARYLR